MNKKNIKQYKSRLSISSRQELSGNSGCVLWFTGLSGAGKSTLASELEYYLVKNKFLAYVLDGDNIRHGLNNDLGFSQKDRTENIRRISEVAKLFYEMGVITLVSFISPCKKDRVDAKKKLPIGSFYEIFIKCSLEKCISRDVKGLYKKAEKGLINNFTGISQKYEIPTDPDLIVETDKYSLSECVSQIIDFLKSKQVI